MNSLSDKKHSIVIHSLRDKQRLQSLKDRVDVIKTSERFDFKIRCAKSNNTCGLQLLVVKGKTKKICHDDLAFDIVKESMPFFNGPAQSLVVYRKLRDDTTTECKKTRSGRSFANAKKRDRSVQPIPLSTNPSTTPTPCFDIPAEASTVISDLMDPNGDRRKRMKPQYKNPTRVPNLISY